MFLPERNSLDPVVLYLEGNFYHFNFFNNYWAYLNYLFLLVSILLGHIFQRTGPFYLMHQIWDREFFYNILNYVSMTRRWFVLALISFLIICVFCFYPVYLGLSFMDLWILFHFSMTSFWFNSIHWFFSVILPCAI